MNEDINKLPTIYDVLLYIYNHNFNEIINYLNILIKKTLNENLKYNINEIIKLCNVIQSDNEIKNKINYELDYKIILIDYINNIINNYFKTSIDISIDEYFNNLIILDITNDIKINYKNNNFLIKNEINEIDIVNIDINLLNYNKNIIKVIFNKNLIIKKLNIILTNNFNKNISIQFNGYNNDNKNILINNKSNLLVQINQLNINGLFSTLFMNTISINFEIQYFNIINNYILSLLYLNHTLINNGKINLININKNNNFKIIITNKKLENYIIYINNEPYILTNYEYKSFSNFIDFYL